MGNSTPVGRTKASQGKSWSSVETKMRDMIKKHPHDHLSSHLVRLRELDISRTDPCAFYRKRELVTAFGQNILQEADVDLENGLYYPDVNAGRYSVSPISPIRYLMKCVRPDTRAIVEFGSGWSSNLFQLFIGLGASRSAGLKYYGGEYTQEGQSAAKVIAASEPRLNYEAFSFDYRNPNTRKLGQHKGHILAFTRHSVEQVDQIDSDLYEQLAQLQAEVTLVHLEPVGWQRNPVLAGKRTAKDVKFFEEIGGKFAECVKDIDQQQSNAAWWSWRLNYNTNLTEIIDAYEHDGKIQKVREMLDFGAVGNALNPHLCSMWSFAKKHRRHRM